MDVTCTFPRETQLLTTFPTSAFSSTFLKDTQEAFPKETYPEHKTVIVSISSLLAVQAFSNWGLYAAGKAARDRFLGVMALEEVQTRTV